MRYKHTRTVIVDAKRTPIGSLKGQLASVPATTLGSIVIKNILDTNKFDKNKVSQVIMGNVLSAGLGQSPARQSLINAGLNNKTNSLTINKMCGSGLQSVMLSDYHIKINPTDIIIAGGMESMSNAPYLSMETRKGAGLGHLRLIDSIILDGLWDVYNDMHMGSCAEICAKNKNFSREKQDSFAIESYKKAQRAQSLGLFNNEIVNVGIPNRKGILSKIKIDEEPDKVIFEKIPKLKPVFKKEGTITAANASKINDGAAALLLMNEIQASNLGLEPLAYINNHTTSAHDPEWFTTAPTTAVSNLLQKENLSSEDIDLWEINEAFSVVTMSLIEDFKIDPDKVNICGGAVSLGHPIGASGARILTTLIYNLKSTNGKYGIATLCIGGGEACALLIEMV